MIINQTENFIANTRTVIRDVTEDVNKCRPQPTSRDFSILNVINERILLSKPRPNIVIVLIIAT